MDKDCKIIIQFVGEKCHISIKYDEPQPRNEDSLTVFTEEDLILLDKARDNIDKARKKLETEIL